MVGVSRDVVVDSSLAVKWVLIEPYDDQARRLLARWIRSGMRRLVPVLFLSEVNTPLLKQRRQGTISTDDATVAFNTVLSAVTVVHEDTGLLHRARAIAEALLLRTAHDCLYVALAERENCDMWTADERFYNLVHGLFPRVRWVGE